MSRIGKKPIQIPAKVKVEVKGNDIKVQGPLATLNYVVPQGITAKLDGSTLTFEVEKGREEELNALYGTTRASDDHIQRRGNRSINLIHIGGDSCHDITLALFAEERQRQTDNLAIDVVADVAYNTRTQWSQCG